MGGPRESSVDRYPPTDPPALVVLVLEGAAKAGVAAGVTSSRDGPALSVVHAPGAGDDAVVAAAAAARPPVLVFTSDRGLRARLVAGGAQVRGSASLWALLDGV
jgi:hypothetical protein